MGFPQTGEGFSIDLPKAAIFILELVMIGLMAGSIAALFLNLAVGNWPISLMCMYIALAFLFARDMLRDWRRGV